MDSPGASMWQGTVVGIFIASEAGAPMQRVGSARAVPGRGLEGDRYFAARGSFSRWPGPHRDLSLIAEEALEEMIRETGVFLAPEASRRNVLVRGVPLTNLIKIPFLIGAVRVEGVRLCEPCKYLARRAGEPDLVAAFTHRGGLRARILTEGIIRPGEAVQPIPADRT